jgi:hypothetical protein
MSEPRPQDPALEAKLPGYVPPQPQPETRARYVVVRGDGNWLIQFDGEEFGPYRTEREAMLFAIDAAYNLGEQGQPTQVVVLGDQGLPRSVWTYGEDRFPPVL